jgi:molecular chaperone GrpE (heat shock protein)
MQNAVQGLRLDVEARDRTILELRQEVDRLRSRATEDARDQAGVQLEQLMKAVSNPVSQLLTQAHLLECEGKPIQAKDVLAVARRLVAALEAEGLTIEGGPAVRAAFDPNRHEALSGEHQLSHGKPAVIRFAGISFRGRLLRKASVTPV